MFSHIVIGFSNFERALAFYRVLMPAIGLKERFVEEDRPWAGWEKAPNTRPLFLIANPHNGHQHDPGNGQMVAFRAEDRRTVDAVFEAAIRSGAVSEGAPGLRPEYHAAYYGAYFRDTEGNKICIVCHSEADND